jgi:uncharacterized membrane protein YoaK (UPF0700 family)
MLTVRLKTTLRASWVLPVVLSTTAGAVDVIGFLALGLFTAHVSGNLCVVAAHYVTGRFSHVGPLLSVPVFLVVLGVVTLAFGRIEKAGYSPRRALLGLQAALLAGCLGLGIGVGPIPDPESPTGALVAMLAVAAMATQNALVKLALKDAPSTAVMTTNITQLAVDLATLVRRQGEPSDLNKARHRASRIFPCIIGFVAGCAAGAVLELHFGLWGLLLPVVLATLAIGLGELRCDGQVTHPGSKRTEV